MEWLSGFLRKFRPDSQVDVVLRAPSITRTLRDLSTDQHEHDWAIAEYSSVRQEIVASQNNQQTALNWGLAVVSGALAGGFALFATGGGPSPAVQLIQLLLFGLILPLLLLGVALIWVGEVRRMMRAGAYIRELEEHLTRESHSKRSPLGWEMTLAGATDRLGAGSVRNWTGYLGAGMIIAGGQLASGIIWSVMQSDYRRLAIGLPEWCTWAGVWVLIAACWALEAYAALEAVGSVGDLVSD